MKPRQALQERRDALASQIEGKDTRKIAPSGYTASQLIEALMLEAKHLNQLGQDFRRKHLEGLEMNDLEIEARDYAQGSALARLEATS
jgi:hypothetical protein